MKKFLVKFCKFITGRAFVSSVLLFGIVFLLLHHFFPAMNLDFEKGSYVYLQSITSSALTEDKSLVAVYDTTGNIYVIKTDTSSLSYMITPDSLKDEYVYGLSFSAENELYVLTFSDSSEQIYRFDKAGEFIGREIYYDHPSSAGSYSGIMTMNYYDECLHYILIDQTCENLSLMKLAKGSSDPTLEFTAELDFYYDTSSLSLTRYGILCSTYDGYVGLIGSDGEFTELLASDFNVVENEHGYYPFISIADKDDSILTVSGAFDQTLVQITDDGEKLLADAKKLYTYSDSGVFTGLYANESYIYFSITDSLYILSRENPDTAPLEILHVDIGYLAWLEFAKALLLPAGIVLLSVGIILLAGNLAKWRLSILTKQLLVILPVVIAANLLLSFMMIQLLKKSFYSGIEKEICSVGSIIAAQTDGDMIGSINDFSYIELGIYDNLIEYLADFDIQSASDSFSVSLYRKGGDIRSYLIAGSDYTAPFSAIDYIDEEDFEKYKVEGQDSYVLTLYSATSEFLSCITPIYNSNGDEVGYVDISAPTTSFEQLSSEMNSKMYLATIVLILVLTLLISLLCYISIRYLKKASHMISTIAEGDFTVHINKTPKDEVGNICQGVNDMARQLESYFVEKDRNEQFYYKFVPEKFRELLHKDSFTDLSLGDAESMDLTVLFCDIRSFSLNSEMMTARENFDFVNRLYGLAGPIIRKHHGFVDKYIGDAVMALFENADDAVAAGIEMYHDIVIDKSCAESLGVSSINIGVGIHSGMARIGIVGEQERMSGTVISNTVNLSSRLEGLTKQYKTAMIISKDTLDRMTNPDSLCVRYLGMIQVAGVNEVKALYEVLDCLPAEARQKRAESSNSFREAVRLYHLGKASASLEILETITSDDDPVPEKYIRYISSRIKDGNNNHNVFVFDRK